MKKHSATAMKSNKNRREYFEAAKFFLLTLFLSPTANPAFIILSIAGAFLMVVGDIKPQDVIFLMFALSLSTVKVGGYFKKTNEEIISFLNVIPLSLCSLLKSIFIASAAFSLLTQLILILLLITALGTPKLGDANLVYEKISDNEIVSVLQGYTTDVSGRQEIPTKISLRPSIIFGIVKSVLGYEARFGILMLLFLIYFLSTIYYVMLSIIGSCMGVDQRQRMLSGVIIVLYIFIGVVNFFDLILPSGIIWKIRVLYLDPYQWVVYAFMICIVFLFIFAIYRLIYLINRFTKNPGICSEGIV